MNEQEYYNGLLDVITRQVNGDATWNDVVQYRESRGIRTTYDYIQRGSQILMEFLRAGYRLTPPNNDTQILDDEADENGIVKTIIKYDGDKQTKTFDDVIDLCESDAPLTPEDVMKKHNLSPAQWEVKSYTDSRQHAYVKGERKVRYRISLTVKPKVNGIDYEEIKQYFADYQPEHAKNSNYRRYSNANSRELLVPCFFDLHFSKLAHVDEVGERNGNFDSKIAKERFIDNAQKYIDKLSHRNFEKILFIVGQDYFNSEADGNTINGTKQDNDSRYSEVFKNGTAALIEVIDMFAEIAPVDVVLVQGNHDEVVSMYCACVLEAFYRNDKDITVDTTPTLRKYYRYGNTLLGLSHGEYEKNRIFELMQVEAKEDWGQTQYHEWILGHLHSESVTERGGVTVRRIPSLTGTDYWHFKNGFTTSPKRSVALIYDYNEGLKDTMYEVV